MRSTLSKYRVLARMVYPEYVEFETWITKKQDDLSHYAFELDGKRIHVTNNGFGNYSMVVDGIRLSTVKLSESWPKYIQTIYVFWQVERFAKGDDSLFAPRRKEP